MTHKLDAEKHLLLGYQPRSFKQSSKFQDLYPWPLKILLPVATLAFKAYDKPSSYH